MNCVWENLKDTYSVFDYFFKLFFFTEILSPAFGNIQASCQVSSIYHSRLYHYHQCMRVIFLLSWVYFSVYFCPVGWGCRIHRLLLCRGGKTPTPQRVSWYDTKQSDGEVPAVLELWGMRSTHSLPSLPGPLWPGVVALDKGPIYRLNRTNSILMLKWITWNRNVFDN